jgi:MFS family permease
VHACRYLALFVSAMGFGKAFEALQWRRNMSTLRVRQWGQFVAIGLASLSLLLVGFIGAQYRYVSYALLIAGQFCFGAVHVALHCSYSDVAPNYASPLQSLGNTIGSVAGVCGPIVVGLLTTAYPDQGGILGWRYTFLLTALMALVALPLWFVYIVADVVPALNTPDTRKTCCS